MLRQADEFLLLAASAHLLPLPAHARESVFSMHGLKKCDICVSVEEWAAFVCVCRLSGIPWSVTLTGVFFPWRYFPLTQSNTHVYSIKRKAYFPLFISNASRCCGRDRKLASFCYQCTTDMLKTQMELQNIKRSACTLNYYMLIRCRFYLKCDIKKICECCL